jgi:hypothetical protein
VRGDLIGKTQAELRSLHFWRDRDGLQSWGLNSLAVRRRVNTATVICPLTGDTHRLFWMRSAWWCKDCRQKIETCCEGDSPSTVALS